MPHKLTTELKESLERMNSQAAPRLSSAEIKDVWALFLVLAESDDLAKAIHDCGDNGCNMLPQATVMSYMRGCIYARRMLGCETEPKATKVGGFS